jgi:hypothetical protein
MKSTVHPHSVGHAVKVKGAKVKATGLVCFVCLCAREKRKGVKKSPLGTLGRGERRLEGKGRCRLKKTDKGRVGVEQLEIGVE